MNTREARIVTGDSPYVREILRYAQDDRQGFVILSVAKDLSRLRAVDPTHVALGLVDNPRLFLLTIYASLNFSRDDMSIVVYRHAAQNAWLSS